ncbi:MAG: class D beta-lactamase [Turneriella sp.]
MPKPSMKSFASLGGFLFIFLVPQWAQPAKLRLLYVQQHGLKATVVIENARSGKRTIFNSQRAAARFSPASTFKIANTLILLEEKALRDADETLPWNGTRYDFPDWNRDQNLRSAFRVSCVWFYQQLARRVPEARYRAYLRQLRFGNATMGKEVDNFWLDGSLKISALEQLAVLRGIYERRFAFSQANYDTLREVMLAGKTEQYSLYAKTGWAARMNPQVGWYVGYIERGGDIWFFVLNLDVAGPADLEHRKKLLYAALAEMQIIK